ncbi:hypothetical protein EKH55_2898 [Sinorhizobium alkalisoli]|nr:hypothetical protein EKH55_2898 [Sinorhizobium alkalisoli]
MRLIIPWPQEVFVIAHSYVLKVEAATTEPLSSLTRILAVRGLKLK